MRRGEVDMYRSMNKDAILRPFNFYNFIDSGGALTSIANGSYIHTPMSSQPENNASLAASTEADPESAPPEKKIRVTTTDGETVEVDLGAILTVNRCFADKERRQQLLGQQQQQQQQDAPSASSESGVEGSAAKDATTEDTE